MICFLHKFHSITVCLEDLLDRSDLPAKPDASQFKAKPPEDAQHAVSLSDRYHLETGEVLLTGIQALVRLPIEQHRADQRVGLNTATLVSGYRGSPLGGLDMTFQREQQYLDANNIRLLPAVNEELGATAIFGSQVANRLPHPIYDGVLGMWYGKAPGVDRATDAFKHANFAGVGRNGGVLALAGDDPISKSSTLPSQSEIALFDSYMPVLYPGNAQEILDLGRLGFELSRYSGLWVGFKIVTNVADEFSTVTVSPDRVIVERPTFLYRGRPWQHTQQTRLLTPFSLALEQELVEGRLEAAKHFAATNGINLLQVNPRDAWLGIVAAGKTFYDVLDALRQLGLTENDLHNHGIRLLKLGMVSPVEPSIVRDFAVGLEEILVIEEKRAFIELFVRDILYEQTERPRILGKHRERGETFIPAHGELDADLLARLIAPRLQQRISSEVMDQRLKQLDQKPDVRFIPLTTRTPHYCSGCPHNSSTQSPDDALVGAGIGCHTMTLLMDDTITGITQMGGEGVQWVGAAPFTESQHMFQNIGDGTLFHSGSLAIRQSVAADATITYKLLYNSAVAMTGGQPADGGLGLPALCQQLLAEGVKRIIVTSDQPERTRSQGSWPPGIVIWHRDRLPEAQETLRNTAGVTVLIHDQECAAELRRKRRRGLAEDPDARVMINEAVCEGCGDCGKKSNCLSVIPVDTEFGRKTQIHQSSCNKDYTCLKGDCPAFVTVTAGAQPDRSHFIEDIERFAIPEPNLTRPDEHNIYMAGIGGTGVVTTNQILGTAALIDGYFVRGLDQTGLSQKGGPVVSHLRLFSQPTHAANRVPSAAADSYLVFDLLSGAEFKNLIHVHTGRTAAAISTSEVATGGMVANVGEVYPQQSRLLEDIQRNIRGDDTVILDAVRLAETLFGSHMSANIILLGAAFQSGLIPVHAAAIEQAIQLNGVSVRNNLAAFAAGRRAVAQPEWLSTLPLERSGDIFEHEDLSAEARHLLSLIDTQDDALRQVIKRRIPELIAYQNRRYAENYVAFVQKILKHEQDFRPGSTRLTEAVARYLFKLMAYKDEYEVARLHLKTGFDDALYREFGTVESLHYHLHPPFLRAIGVKNKIKLGRWFRHIYRLLLTMRHLRGTPLDIFGYAQVRKIERQLIHDYRNLIDQTLQNLNDDTYEDAVKLAELPDIIRGYEEIKLANVEAYRAAVRNLGYQTEV